MAEGRKCQVLLQDDRRLHFLIQPKLLTSDLMDMVASHFTLKEKEFFGLAFHDDSGHLNWLQLDRRVLEHDYPKKTGPLLLHFQVKFFIESIAYLRDGATIEVFYLQAKQSVYKGTVEADSDTVFELAAHVLQESHGNYVDDPATRKDLKKMPVLPIRTLKEHPSLNYCEDEIIIHYKKLSGLSRGSAIVNYMTIVESLPTYGIHHYEVKDKSGLPWWIGLSYKGIAQYDYTDKKVPRRVFAWKQLENLYFRDKKFSIEVLDPKRIVHTVSEYNLYEAAYQEPIQHNDQLTDDICDPSTQVSVSRRTFGPSNVNVFAWFTTTPQLTKCIWSMAVSQHQFYLDRKQSKSNLPAVRSMSEIAADLCQSTPSLGGSATGSDNISQCSSSASLQQKDKEQQARDYHERTGTLPRHNEVSAEEMEEIRAAQKEMYQALKARREALELALKKKTEELKNICMKEAELTGDLPIETPLEPGETAPVIRRRIGTGFSLSPKILDREHRSQDEECISKLELEYELQKQICHAAQKLAQDGRLNKKARKQRKTQYINAHLKLKNIERKLKEAIEHCRRYRSHSTDETEFTPGHSPAHPHRRGSEPYRYESKSSLESDQSASRPSTLQRDGTIPSTNSSQCSLPEYASPHSPAKHLSRESSPSPNRPVAVGYMPSSVYTTRTQYRNQTYPTFSIRSHSLSSTHSDFDSQGSMHRDGSRSDIGSRSDVGSSRTELGHGDSVTHFDTRTTVTSSQESRAPVINPYVTVNSDQDYRYIYDEERLQNIARTGSLDKAFRRRRPSAESKSSGEERRYASLERNFTYNRDRVNQDPDYIGQYEITHIEESDYDAQPDWYTSSLPPNVQDTTRSPAKVGAGGDVHRPRFYIDEQEQCPVQHQTPDTFTTVHEYQHFREESKPFEMSDFYQYSEKLRRQRVERRQSEERQKASSPTLSHSSSASSDRTACVPQLAQSVRVGTLSPSMDYAYPLNTPAFSSNSATSPTQFSGHTGPFLAIKPGRSPYNSPQVGRSQRNYSQPPPPAQLRCEPVDDERPRTPTDRLLHAPGTPLTPTERLLHAPGTPLTPGTTDSPRTADGSFNLEPPEVVRAFSQEMFEWYDKDQQEQEAFTSSLV